MPAPAHTAPMPLAARLFGILSKPCFVSTALAAFKDLKRWTNSMQSHPDAVFRKAIARTRKANENSTAVFILQEKILNLLKISNMKETNIRKKLKIEDIYLRIVVMLLLGRLCCFTV